MDLNRNFPDPILHKSRGDLRRPVGKEEVETLAIMNFSLSYRYATAYQHHVLGLSYRYATACRHHVALCPEPFA